MTILNDFKALRSSVLADTQTELSSHAETEARLRGDSLGGASSPCEVRTLLKKIPYLRDDTESRPKPCWLKRASAQQMAIGTAGIINQNWANALREMIAGDGYVDYYIETTNYGENIPIEPADADVIRRVANVFDLASGLRLRETQDINGADVLFTQVDSQFFDNPIDEGTLGYAELVIDELGNYFDIVYVDNEATYTINNLPDNIVIQHEWAHAVGLSHPYGDGFNPNFTLDDTIMSYNPPTGGTAGLKDSDLAAIRFLWGEAGTNYDALSTSSSTISSIDNVIKGSNEKDKLKGTNGNDKIIGKGGADKIFGEGGDDLIDPGEWRKGDGPDKIYGGSGADIFVINDDCWVNIKDFNVIEDRLDISGLSGGLDWEIEGNRTYIWRNDGDEVARISGAVDLSQANII